MKHLKRLIDGSITLLILAIIVFVMVLIASGVAWCLNTKHYIYFAPLGLIIIYLIGWNAEYENIDSPGISVEGDVGPGPI